MKGPGVIGTIRASADHHPAAGTYVHVTHDEKGHITCTQYASEQKDSSNTQSSYTGFSRQDTDQTRVFSHKITT